MIVWRGLKRLGITRKKKTLRAAEQDRPEVRRKRTTFRRAATRVPPERLVFVDESGATTDMTPAYGRAPRGRRVEVSAPASRKSVTSAGDGLGLRPGVDGALRRHFSDDLRGPRRAGSRAGAEAGGRRGLRQPVGPPRPGGDRGDREGRCVGAAAAPVQPRPGQSSSCSRRWRSGCGGTVSGSRSGATRRCGPPSRRSDCPTSRAGSVTAACVQQAREPLQHSYPENSNEGGWSVRPTVECAGPGASLTPKDERI